MLSKEVFKKEASTELAQQLERDVKLGRVENNDSGVVVHPEAFLKVRKISRDEAERAKSSWLRNLRLTLNIGHPVKASELVNMLRERGLNITSNLPLDNYTYAGFGVTNVDAETGLQILLGSMGLDYELDNDRRVVSVQPMGSRTWYINVGRRQSTYSAATGAAGGGGASGSASGGGASGGGASGGGAPSGEPSGGSGGGGGSGGSGGGSGSGGGGGAGQDGTSVSITDDFWGSLSSEIKSRLSVMVPAPKPPGVTESPLPSLPQLASGAGGLPMPQPLSMPAMPQSGSAAGAAGQPLYEKQTFGSFSTNPETGAITVQAPRWLLDKLDKYLSEVQTMYNAELTFEGMLVLINAEDMQQEGLDITSFARFASSKYRAVYTNNSLGGVTLSFPGNLAVPNVGGGEMSLTQPLIGLSSPLNGFQIFSAYLSKFADVKVLQRPVLSTTSGVPTEFSKRLVRYYNQYSGSSTTVSGGAATASINNTLVPINIGTMLRVNPRYDVKQNLIRTQITLQQELDSGDHRYDQYLSSTGSPITTNVPIITKLEYRGEALLRDGDMIIIGGMQDDTVEGLDSGVTKLKDNPRLSGLFGQKRQIRQNSTFYFALRVKVVKK